MKSIFNKQSLKKAIFSLIALIALLLVDIKITLKLPLVSIGLENIGWATHDSLESYTDAVLWKSSDIWPELTVQIGVANIFYVRYSSLHWYQWSSGETQVELFNLSGAFGTYINQWSGNTYWDNRWEISPYVYKGKFCVDISENLPWCPMGDPYAPEG